MTCLGHVHRGTRTRLHATGLQSWSPDFLVNLERTTRYHAAPSTVGFPTHRRLETCLFLLIPNQTHLPLYDRACHAQFCTLPGTKHTTQGISGQADGCVTLGGRPTSPRSHPQSSDPGRRRAARARARARGRTHLAPAARKRLAQASGSKKRAVNSGPKSA